MKPRSVILVLALALGLSACGGAATSSSNIAPVSDSVPAMEAPAPANGSLDGSTAAGGAAPGAPSQAQPSQAQQFDRLVIKTADLSLQVESVRDAEAAVRAKVQTLGGYVVRAENSGSDDNLTARITFRVPAQRFDEALAGVQGLAKKVLSRTVSGDDVTEEFVDLQSRLRNLEATRDRLLSFLEKAATVEEALKVNESLSQVQGEVEQVRGRIEFLKQSAALSTVTVALAPVPSVAPIVEEGGWQPLAVARSALRELVELGQGLASVAIVLLVWTPVWLPLVLLLWWLRRRFWVRVRKPASETA
jgi:Domain of unknown function (DUF4349)